MPTIYTYWDAVSALDEFAQSIGVSVSPAPSRRYIEEAYNEITVAHDWRFLHATGRVMLQAPQTTGTVAFDYSGGTYERQLTLVGSTWPTWIENGCVRIGNNICDVELRKSDTVVTLDAQMCPLADVAAGTTYSAFPRWYILPSDMMAMDSPMNESDWQLGSCRSVSEVLSLVENDDTTGDIQFYAVGSAPDLYGSKALYVWPPSDTAEVLTFSYKRRPRELQYVGTTLDCPGTIVATAGSSSVVGTSTAFSTDMAGSILRNGTSTSALPTGKFGQYRYSEQRVIHSAPAPDLLHLDANVTTTRSGVKYSITDPVDLEWFVYDAFMACARRNLAIEKSPKTVGNHEMAYRSALARAKSSDSTVSERRIAGTPNVTWTRLADSTSREVTD